jgi:hypothetical protein
MSLYSVSFLPLQHVSRISLLVPPAPHVSFSVSFLPLQPVSRIRLLVPPASCVFFVSYLSPKKASVDILSCPLSLPPVSSTSKCQSSISSTPVFSSNRLLLMIPVSGPPLFTISLLNIPLSSLYSLSLNHLLYPVTIASRNHGLSLLSTACL